MGKKKASSDATSDTDIDGIGDNEGYESEVSVSGGASGDLGQEYLRVAESHSFNDTPCNTLSAKARERLETKRRLDAYLERKMLTDSGWDEDDELFDDEYFSEIDSGRAQ